jgi:hypothetical protein
MKETLHPARLLLTKVDAGLMLGCSDDTIARLVRAGHLREVGTDYGPRVLYSSCVAYVQRKEAEEEARIRGWKVRA